VPPRKRKTPTTVTVDPADLTAVLTVLAMFGPSMFSQHVARSAVNLETALGEHGPEHGVFPMDWGMRAGDQA
jgi:hypothetical protein